MVSEAAQWMWRQHDGTAGARWSELVRLFPPMCRKMVDRLLTISLVFEVLLPKSEPIEHGVEPKNWAGNMFWAGKKTR